MIPVRGILLDVDGTLVDSNDAHAHAWQKAQAASGRNVPFAAIRRCIGMGGDKLLPQIAGISAASPSGKKITDTRAEIFERLFLPGLKPFPRAKEFLQHLRSQGYRLAVASSAKEKELQSLLRICGADELIEATTCSDDAANSKPDHDIIHAALGKLGLQPAETLLLGDTPYDLEACRKASVRFIGVRSGGWEDASLGGADAIYDDVADLLRGYDTSILRRDRQT